MGKTKTENLAATKATEVTAEESTVDTAALIAENEALRAQLAALEAKKGTNAVAAAPEEDRVDLFIPRGYANDEPNLPISVNGVTYLLPKGKTSKVPKHIAEEYYRSQRAQAAMDEKIDKMLEAAK